MGAVDGADASHHHRVSSICTAIRASRRYGFVGSTRVKQNSRPQQVIDGLAEWLFKASKSQAQCKLGREPRRWRGSACSGCTAPQELEINKEITRLIDLEVFRRPGVCPYRVVA